MRLSAIIHRLREEHEIVTHIVEDTDKFGNTVRYADYEYKGEINFVNFATKANWRHANSLCAKNV